jgi:PTH1 family peptidyl-tRNA hydrolase
MANPLAMGGLKRLFGRFRTGRRAQGDEHPAARIEWVVAGLGNPEPKYRKSRHNSGFMVIDRLAELHGAELARRRFKGLTAETTIGAVPVMLVKPETYYNLSGDCIGAILGYFRISAERLIVVHDELDLEPGRLRLKRGGGSAGNRGIISIEAALGTADFIRVRVGIGRSPAQEDDKEYLLKPMNEQELEAFRPIASRAAQAVETIVTEGLERAMNLFNQRSPASAK